MFHTFLDLHMPRFNAYVCLKRWSFITVLLPSIFTQKYPSLMASFSLYAAVRPYYLYGANQSMSLMSHVALVWCYWRQPGMKVKWVSTISYCLRIKHHMPHTWPSTLFCSETERTPVTFQTSHCTAQPRRVSALMNWHMYSYLCQMAELSWRDTYLLVQTCFNGCCGVAQFNNISGTALKHYE